MNCPTIPAPVLSVSGSEGMISAHIVSGTPLSVMQNYIVLAS